MLLALRIFPPFRFEFKWIFKDGGIVKNADPCGVKDESFLQRDTSESCRLSQFSLEKTEGRVEHSHGFVDHTL